MHIYTASETVALTKRLNNPKRTYLLANPLQAKHLPSRPGQALEMMTTLGQQIAVRYPAARLVIGFAETATAIAAAVAGCLGPDCIYIHTTREARPNATPWICFREEHSHAVEQRLSGARLAEWISHTPQIIFVDDEFSTGKTLLNIVHQLREQYPCMEGRTLVAASILNRLSDGHTLRLQQAGIRSECLVRLPHEDLSAAVARYQISAPPLPPDTGPAPAFWTSDTRFPDPRLGLPIGIYAAYCRSLAATMTDRLTAQFPAGSRLLVLGTEECMYPALLLACALERCGLSVLCHATTRSPIGICQDSGYPVRAGVCLHSFYDAGRTTYLYNPGSCDGAVIVTDTPADDREAAAGLAAALGQQGCGQMIVIEGGKDVQQL